MKLIFQKAWLSVTILAIIVLNLMILDSWKFDDLQATTTRIERIDQNGNTYDITTDVRRITGKPFVYSVSYGEVKNLNINDKVTIHPQHREWLPVLSQKVTKPVIQTFRNKTPYLFIAVNIILFINELALRNSIIPVKHRRRGQYIANNPYLESFNALCMMITVLSLIASLLSISNFG